MHAGTHADLYVQGLLLPPDLNQNWKIPINLGGISSTKFQENLFGGPRIDTCQQKGTDVLKL
jgi:hypothetical protein